MATQKNKVNPLDWRVPIANKDGTPTDEFQRKWQQQAATNGEIPALSTAAEVSEVLDVIDAAPNSILVRGTLQWTGWTPTASSVIVTSAAGDLTSLAFAGDATKFLNGATPAAFAKVKDSDLSVTNVTTNNVSITAHGFAPILPNDATKFLNGAGGYTVPAYPAVPTAANPTATASDTAINGSATTFMRSDAAPPVQKGSATQFGILKVDGTTITATGGVITSVGGGAIGANPTATAGPTAVNGSATTYMRSDAAPPVQKASASQFGIVEVDNTTITASGGVISTRSESAALDSIGSTEGDILYRGLISWSALAPAASGAGAYYLSSGGPGGVPAWTLLPTIPAAANPTATAGPTAVNGSATTYMRSDAAPPVQKASASQFGIVEVDNTTITASGGVISTRSESAALDSIGSTEGDILYRGLISWSALAPAASGAGAYYLSSGGPGGVPAWTLLPTIPAAANPTATAGPTAVNGSATTYMRSDAAPPVQKASASQFGIVEVDNTTITASGGVISTRSESAALDSIGSTEGDILYRGLISWSALAPAASGAGAYYLSSGGPGGVPAWTLLPTIPAAANPTATAGPTAVNGSATTYMRSDAAPPVQKASASQFGIVEVDNTTITASGGVISTRSESAALDSIGSTEGDILYRGLISWSALAPAASGAGAYYLSSGGPGGVPAWTLLPTIPAAANPTATAGLTAVNGSATTYMRSDAAPPISQSISPTWSGTHVFSNDITVNGATIGRGGDSLITNLAIGYEALLNNTTGTYNLAIGYEALLHNTTGTYNLAIGYAPLFKNTTGGHNNAIGSEALLNNTTGSDNFAIGYSALLNNTTGTGNTAIGYEALLNNTTGTYNLAIGYATLADMGSIATAGSFVVGVSYTILTIGTTDFTLIGAASNTVGLVFSATGVGSGTGTATPNGSYNTVIGYDSGRGITSGSSNTIIGARVLGLAANLSNNIIIADGAGHQRITGDASGNVNVPVSLAVGKTTAPAQVLDVAGNGIFTGATGKGGQRIIPVTGFSQTTSNNVETLFLNPVGTLATGTVTMPAAPLGNQRLLITTTQTITALTINGNTGQTIATAGPYTLTAAAPLEFIYNTTDAIWYRAR